MDKDIETMVAEIEARAEKATPGPWETDDFRMVMTSHPVGDDTVDVCEILHRGEGAGAFNNYTAQFIASAREDVPKLCAMWREAVAERDALRDRLRIVQSTDDGNLDAKAQALADLFAGKNVDGCIATEDEIVAVRKTLSLRAKERQTASERIAELTELLERVRDLDSLNDLLDLMPTIVNAIGPSPALLTPPPRPTQP